MILLAVVKQLALADVAHIFIALVAVLGAWLHHLDVAFVLQQLILHVVIPPQAILVLGLEVLQFGDFALVLDLLEVINHLDFALELLDAKVLDVLGLLGPVHLYSLEDIVD